MSDGYTKIHTQTFTDEEFEQYGKDAATHLEQNELAERVGVELKVVHVDWDESRHIKELPPGVEPEFYDTYVVFADKLNPFSVIFTKDDDHSAYHRLRRPSDLAELDTLISEWVNDC